MVAPSEVSRSESPLPNALASDLIVSIVREIKDHEFYDLDRQCPDPLCEDGKHSPTFTRPLRLDESVERDELDVPADTSDVADIRGDPLGGVRHMA